MFLTVKTKNQSGGSRGGTAEADETKEGSFGSKCPLCHYRRHSEAQRDAGREIKEDLEASEGLKSDSESEDCIIVGGGSRK